MHMDWRDFKKGLRTASGKSPDISRRHVVARDLQCGGTWQSPPPEDAKECVPGPQQALFRGSNCPGHAPSIASRRPRANHSGVTPRPQGIHMTQNLYYSVKDARRMPGVVTLHQDSETQSKPTYFRGHHWGVVGLLVGSLAHAFCLPLEARLHQGFAHVREDETDEAQRQTLAVRLIRMALQFAVRHDTPTILVLDAFFAIAPVFQLAASLWALRLKQPYLHLL